MNTRQVISASCAAAISFLVAQSHAATPATASFNVNLNLTAACTVAAPSAMSFAYTALGSAVSATGGTGGTVTCTENLPFTMFLDDGAGAQASGATKSYTDTDTNLTYSLTLTSATSPGTGAAQSYSVAGSMAASQAGKCATATCTPTAISRTIYVNY